jgi:hypothetical protein
VQILLCSQKGFISFHKDIGNVTNNIRYARSARTLYITISKGYTPQGSREKNYFIATKKRNLLLSKRAATLKYLNEEVST